MARTRSQLQDLGVYLAVRLVVCLLQSLPDRPARAFAHGLAWLAYQVDRRHREVAADNLRKSFPGKYSEAEIDRLVRAVYVHFCTLIVELVQLPRRLQGNTWRRHLDVSEALPLIDRVLSNRPLLIVTGHFGNWELAGYVMGVLGVRTYAVARDLDNPYLDQFLRRFRESRGQSILSKKGDFDRMQEILGNNGILATLGDQDAGQKALYVDFFGRPASTHKAMALMCLEHKVTLLLAGTARVGEGLQYKVVIGDVIDPAEYEGRPDAIKAITQRFTTALENIIRQYPEQYFWLHRRWKHQPTAKKTKKAA